MRSVISIQTRFKLRTMRSPSTQSQILFLSRLSNLIKRGYPLLNALSILQFDPALKQVAEEVHTHLLSGTPLHQALEKLGFSKYAVSYLYFSREYGNLEKALSQSSEILNQQLSFRKRFQNVLRYPVILFGLFFCLLIFVKSFLLPSFLQLYASMNIQSLTILTILKWLDRSLYGLFGVCIIAILLVASMYIIQHRASIHSVLSLYRRIPLWRTYIMTQTSYLFSYHLSSLLQSGMSIKQCLLILKNQHHFSILSFHAHQIYQELEKGMSLSSSVKQQYFIRDDLANLIRRNQNDGRLDQDLAVYAEWITEELQNKILRLLAFIQPLMFSLLAVFIMLIYASIMLPLLEWMNQI